MTTDRVTIYNGALLLCEEDLIADLTDTGQAKLLLDHVWTRGSGVITAALEEGLWNFAMRTVQIDYDTAVTPQFGLRRAFSRPADWIQTAGIWQDEYLTTPLTAYRDENDYWYADLDTIYVQYVSNDDGYGSDLSLWPESFSRYVEAYLAYQIIGKLAHAKTDKDELRKEMDKRLKKAKSKDAQNEATRFLPEGSWVRSRRGRFGSRSDRGSRSSLIG